WVVSLFFSSRRRHTRFSRDWSSDVCSSDLVPLLSEIRQRFVATRCCARSIGAAQLSPSIAQLLVQPSPSCVLPSSHLSGPSTIEIGRASGRERKWGSGDTVPRREESKESDN